jgi:hypothetical protein
VNQRTAPVYVDTDCNIAFDVVVSGVAHHGGLIKTDITCGQAESRPRMAGDCASAGTPIPPGGTWETQWSGLFYDEVTQMPDACYATPPDQPVLANCVRPTVASPGPMQLSAHVFATSHPNSNWPTVGDPLPAEKDFTYGADSVVEVDVL